MSDSTSTGPMEQAELLARVRASVEKRDAEREAGAINPPTYDEMTDDERAEVNEKARRARAENRILRAVDKTGWWWPSED